MRVTDKKPCSRCGAEWNNRFDRGLCQDCRHLPKIRPDLLDALLPFLERPISPKRWFSHQRAILSALEERAEESGRTCEEELFIAAVLAVRIAVEEGREARLQLHHAELVHWYRKRIQNLVTVDLLGLDWRRHERPEPPAPAEPARPDALADAVSEYEVRARRLSESQREFAGVWAELIVAGMDPDEAKAEAGERTGRNPNAVRQIHSRIRERNAEGGPSGVSGREEAENPNPSPQHEQSTQNQAESAAPSSRGAAPRRSAGGVTGP